MKNMVFAAFTGLLFSAIWACSQTPDPQPMVTAAEMADSPDAIDPKKAVAAIEEWDSLRQVIISKLKTPQDSIFIPKGFHIPFDDIKGILANTGDTSQLFAMLAIQHDTVGSSELTLIFQAPDKSPRQTLKYYDFTKPCPTNCPQK